VPGGSDYRKQPVDMKAFVVACSQFGIAVCTVVDGTLCLFSDAACCSQLSVTSQLILMVKYSVHSGYWKNLKLNCYICNMYVLCAAAF
jgi:hypothetical protein